MQDLHSAALTHSEFYMMETLFKNPETSVPAHMRHPLDQFKFSMRKRQTSLTATSQNSAR